MSTLRATGSRLQHACWLLLSLAALHSCVTVDAQAGCPTITPPPSGPRNRTVNIAMMFWGPPLDDVRFSSNGTRKEVWTRNPMLDGWNGPSPIEIMFLRSYLLWEERMELPAAHGGGPGLVLLDGSIMRFNITWFNAGELFTLVDSQSEYAEFYQRTWAYTLIKRLADPNGPYGRQHFIVTPLQGHVPISVLTSLACEETQSCMVIISIATEARMFICQDPMPIDCTDRGRRTGSRRFEYTVSPASNGDYWGSGSLSLAVNQGVRRVFVITEPWTDAIVTQLRATAAQLGLEVVGVQRVMTLGDDWAALNTSAADVTHRIQAARVDMVLFISAFATPTLHQLLAYWREIDYLPTAVAYVAGGSAFLPDDVRSYFMLETYWLPQLTGPAFHAVSSESNFETFPANATHDSSTIFADAYRQRFDVHPPVSVFYQAARAFHAVTIVQKLLELAQTEETENVRQASMRIATPGAFHAVQFDQWGRSLPFDNFVAQYMPDGSERVLTPLGLGSPPVLPIPLWSERTYSSHFLSETSDCIAFAFAALTIFYLLGWLAWLVRYWHHALIRVRDPLFSALSLFGLMLLVSSNFFATFHQTDMDCAVAPRLFLWGLTLGFAPLVLKNLRIWSLWHNRSNTFAPATIKQWHLGVALIALLAIDSIISLAWLLETGMTANRVTPDPHRPALDYYTCEPFAHGRAYLAVHIGWKAVCLALAMWLAYLLRDVSSAFSESRSIALCVYNATVVLAIFFPIIATDAAGHEGTLLLRNYLLIFLALATSSLSCVPKCIAVRASEAKRLEQEAVNRALNAMYTPEQEAEADTLGSQDQSPQQQQRQVQVHVALPALPEEQAHSMDDPVNRSWVNPAALGAAALQSMAAPAVCFQSSIGGAVVARHPVHPAASSLHPSQALASEPMGATRPPPSVRIQPRAAELEMSALQPVAHLLRLPPIPQSHSPTSVDDADSSPSMLGESRDLLEALTSEELRMLHSTLVHRAARQQHPRLSPSAPTPLCSPAASSACSSSSGSSGSSTSGESSRPAAPSRQMSLSLAPLSAVVVHMD